MRGGRYALIPEPLTPHLFDIISDPAAVDLILGGGFGIRLKQLHLQETGAGTLISEFPEARTTQDLDFFLQMVLFTQKERGNAVRELLNRLNYQEHTPRWQFGKPSYPGQPEIQVKVDLLARTPRAGENVLVKPPRVGVGANSDIHGRETPEAFAIEEKLLRIPLSGFRSDGKQVNASVLLPHPYASLNMKVKAAHDWLQMGRELRPQKQRAERHVFDVYLLVAMCTEPEMEEAAELARHYQGEPMAKDVCACARELFSTKESAGVNGIRRQLNAEMDYEIFWTALSKALSIS